MDSHRPPQSLSDAIDDHLLRLRQMVDEHGWGIQVAQGSSQGTPAFVHTVGFGVTLDHPEIVIYGLPQHVAGGICNHVGQLIASGRGPTTDVRTPGLIPDYDVVLIEVTDPDGMDDLVVVGAMWPDLPIRAWQLVWPDVDGRFPWNPESDPDFAANQPIRGAAPRV